MDEEQLILVDNNDVQIGAMGKLETHRKGLLHRAFSIFVGNDRREIMLQKRSTGKYHCGGLWTNTCCGHPRDGEELLLAAHRRLREEMGFDCVLRESFVFSYSIVLENGLQENEIDHVLVGRYGGDPILNPEEADDWKWVKIGELRADVLNSPGKYTYWFMRALEEMGKRGIDLHRLS